MKSKWKKVVDAKDLKIFEYVDSRKNEKKIVEARLVDGKWHIIKKEKETVNEYLVDEKDFDLFLRKVFKDEIKIKQNKNTEPVIKFYRLFKDSICEKWVISINNESYSNVAYIYATDLISVDLILHMKYKFLEKKILDELKITLGIYNEDIEFNVYYYSYSQKFFEMNEFNEFERWEDED
ncbi:MAG: hypothetical protein QXD62_03620 [Candidatus Woesearchaeota archaeon]